MPRLRVNLPLWLDGDAAKIQVRFPRLTRKITADVVVVGGGITGAAAAWRFADAGVRVVLVEARRIGRGSSSATTALLMQEPDEDFTLLAKRYGTAKATRIWELSVGATHEFVRTLAKLRISCDLVRRDSVYYAATLEHAGRLRDEHRRRVEAGFRGRWLTGAAVRRAVGFDAPAALRTQGNAQADPFRACVGMIRAAVRGGATVFENSPVTAIVPSRHDVVVDTGSGSIRADRVVIATGYATPYFKPLDARFRMLNTYVVATRPLTARQRRSVGLGPVMLWDTGRPYFYARWTADHRLLLGGGDRRLVPERLRAAALLEGARTVRDHFVRLYPPLADIAIDYTWEGLFATTPDGLPYIGPHRRYPRHLFALGYGGNGMTLGFLASKLLLDYYRGMRSPDQELFAFTRKPA